MYIHVHMLLIVTNINYYFLFQCKIKQVTALPTKQN